LRRVVWNKFIDVSEVLALLMEAASISKTSVNLYLTTRRYNPEDGHLKDRNMFRCGETLAAFSYAKNLRVVFVIR
jgi:hypothetical protein